MTSTLITGISELTTNDPEAGPGISGFIYDGSLVVSDGRIDWIGPAAEAPAADDSVDVGGRAALPGWVDSHTHLVFAGDRSAEFSARMAGQAYAAGGMISTVTATRSASDAELEALVRARLSAMYAQGTTTVESKTGYGLTVAEEARVTAEAWNCEVSLLADVGVAGLHRFLSRLDRLKDADALVVVAGMEGALPSVVGGLAACPVIAVPTSVGYGAHFHGLAALLGMLNSCASNIAVVNIDAGFNGGHVAGLIARRAGLARGEGGASAD